MMNLFGVVGPRSVSNTACLSTRLACLTFLLLPLLTAADHTPTVYEALEDYDFPVGILPKGVIGYDLDKTTGKFSAYFNGSCSFSIEGSYHLTYGSTIKGHISRGKLTKLEGISVKVFFFWLNIVEVVRHGDDLVFSVGITSANFAVDNFVECPQCGCGMDCVNAQVRSIRINPFASSSSSS
ncbi:PREDICTED: uncharacterized protein At5g01610-like [Nelumbo nucifera]|uniref:Uncharacterized protein At5g01610-like n=1 Tax=Nelumbo nucifera TaxID=4432 RepID=A0A1U8AT38_NELNU|nr:PREDICTED: uncharacterized protein At5g01610-like [Nelumbo nucifera]